MKRILGAILCIVAAVLLVGQVWPGSSHVTPTASALLTPEAQAAATPAAASQTAVTPAAASQAVGTPDATSQAETPYYGYTVVQEYPHDRQAYTQGLLWDDGYLYEGTGMWGESSLRKVELETGAVLQMHSLAPEYFGEGLALVDERLIQLTWQHGIGFIYEQETFNQIGDFEYTGEGWGLTYDGSRLIMSDGTSELRFLDPITLAETGRVQVLDQGRPVTNINELEYIHGEVFANIWQTDRIARIDPLTGTVTGWIDLSGLLSEEDRQQPVDVLNGIAYDAAGDRLFVTGKWWPKLFEIRLVSQPGTMVPLVATP